MIMITSNKRTKKNKFKVNNDDDDDDDERITNDKYDYYDNFHVCLFV